MACWLHYNILMSKRVFNLKPWFAMCGIWLGLGSVLAWADVGFFPLRAIPAPIQSKLERSVFKIFVPAGNLRTLHFQSREHYERLIAWIESNNDPALRLSIPIIRECEVHNQADCEVWDTINNGTGFLAESSMRLWTAYHVARPYIDTKIAPGTENRFERIRRLEIPILILDAAGKTVLGPASVKIGVLNHYVEEDKIGKDTNEFFDFIALDCPNPIGTPLEVNLDQLPLGAQVYIPGFPEKTTDRANAGGPDSDCQSMSITKGHTISVVEAFKRRNLDVNQYINLSFQENIDRYQILSTADGNDAQSGAPILDAAGKVVGIHTQSLRLGITDPNSTVNKGIRLGFIRTVNPNQ
jgi:hypothetical protein